jgi:hypothetical protein
MAHYIKIINSNFYSYDYKEYKYLIFIREDLQNGGNPKYNSRKGAKTQKKEKELTQSYTEEPQRVTEKSLCLNCWWFQEIASLRSQ